MQMLTPPGEHGRQKATGLPVLPPGNLLAFWLVCILFFLWGCSNNLTDILVQQFKKSFELSPVQAQLVQTANFLGYFLMALPAAIFMRRLGYKAGILAGLGLFGTGLLLFWPAAVIGHYGPFLAALFLVGSGAATLETAANPFMAQFGNPETSEQRLNVAQAFNPPGTFCGVLMGTFFIFSGVELSPVRIAAMRANGTYGAYLHGEIMRVVPTYVGLAAAVLIMGVLLARTRFPVIGSEEDAGAGHGNIAALFRYPHLWLAVVTQFFYMGAQVCTVSALIPYMKQYTAVSERQAGYFLTGTLVALAVGRFVSTPLMRFIHPARMIGIYALVNMGLLAVGVLSPGMTGTIAILLTSFFMSVMFPTIFALGIKGLGPNTKLGGSLIVMSIVGGAILPLVLGLIVRHTGSYAQGYWVPFAGFVAVAAYGFYGSRTVGEPVTTEAVLTTGV